MNDNDFLPIILGSDENAYGTARLFREFTHRKPLLLCTKQLTPTYHSRLFTVQCIEDFEKETVFPQALLSVLQQQEKEAEKIVVVSCSDYYTGLLSTYYDTFEGRIANPFPSAELMCTLDTKDRFYKLCDTYGLDYPSTVVCTPQERRSVVEHLPFPFPIVVKPENSNSLDYLRCHFEGQKKVFFFQCKKDYLAMIDQMEKSEYQGKLILQEWIPGGDDAMRVLNSYSDREGKVRAMCLGQPVLEYYDPKSVGNYAAILSCGDTPLYHRLQRFLEAISYVGFSNIDMKYDCRTGRYVLFEINPRLGRSSFFVYATGMNLMKLMVDDIVYHRTQPCLYNQKQALWSNVPSGVLRHYVKNEELQRKIRTLPTLHTLYYHKDMSFLRWYRISRYYLSQYRAFHQYYFDKNQPQCGR